MSVFGTRLIHLDDAHPFMKYEGDWEIDSWVHDDLAHRPIGSQHRTYGEASMTFDFRGQQVALSGTIRTTTDASGALVAPNWRCTVDGDEIYRPEPEARALNLYQYCSTSNVTLRADIQHTFRIDVQASEEAPFWLDLIFVRPTRAVSTHAEFFDYSSVLQHTDASLRFGPGWDESVEITSRYTTTAGSQVDLEFIGTKLIWMGRYIRNQSSSPSTGDYSLNGGPFIEFPINGLREDQTDPGEFVVLETEELPRGRHNLSVVFRGADTAPLVLDYLVVPDGDFFDRDPRTLGPELDGMTLRTPSSTTSGSPSSSSGSNAPAKSTESSTTPLGPIIGGAVGGVVFLILAALAGFFLYRHRKKKHLGIPQVNLDPQPTSQFMHYAPGPSYQGSSPMQATTIASYPATGNPQSSGYQGSTPVAYVAPLQQSAVPSLTYKRPSPVTYTTVSPNAIHAPEATSNFNPFSPYPPTSPSIASSSPTVLTNTSYSSKGQVHLTATPPIAPTYHQDSGIRLARSELESSVPPAYTPS
ncbi:hypothetical protein FA15DRAFT_670696 [Coprinopsis marcescibilis]|uniref:Uncharacterized protein n=1 Tax=Coprinopsis marcescibilis TaxID=230819 RepID=A0A5C3KSG9_COPMA|nr:hypothetical protein FA15DRAFT_670696 [Coprinopsis marcescibilis]